MEINETKIKFNFSVKELVAAVDAHALENYEKGWDIWIETKDQAEKESYLRKVKTVKGAIKRAWGTIKDKAANKDYRKRVNLPPLCRIKANPLTSL